MNPAGYHKQLAPFGHITLDGVLIRGLVDTSVSVSCLALHNRAAWRALHPYHQAIRGAKGKVLPIAGSMRYLRLK